MPPEGGAPPRRPEAPAGGTGRPPASASELWSRVIELASDSVRTQTLLGAGRPLSWREGTLSVEVAGPMRSVVEHRREELEGLLRRAAGRKVTLEVVAPEAQEAAPASVQVDPMQLAREHPLVRQAMELFGGRVETAYLKKKP